MDGQVSGRCLPAREEEQSNAWALLHRWVHPGLLTLVAVVMGFVPEQHAGIAFLGMAGAMIGLLAVLEAVAPYEERSQTHRGELFGVLGFGIAAYIAGKLAEPVSAWLVSYLPLPATLADTPLAVQIVVGVLAVELCFYAWHRAGHEVPWLWRLHRVHHVPTKVNLGTYFVFHPFDAFMFGAVRFVPLMALGVSEQAFFLIATVGFAHKLLCHSNVGGPMGWVSWVVGTAENHRIHHSRDAHEAGNYGFVLPVWDHVFGTFVHLNGETPRAYGVFAGDTGPRWLNRVLGAEPRRSRRLRQRMGRMADLSERDRRELVRVREQRLYAQDDAATQAERERVLADLAHYTHVTRGFDEHGVVRYFSALRVEPCVDGRNQTILLGPHFKERGYYVVAPVAQLTWHLVAGFVRRPWVRMTLGSAVSLAGYAMLAQNLRGVIPIRMWGDDDLPPTVHEMLERLQSETDEQVAWDTERRLIRYPVGVHLEQTEASRLMLTEDERERYLARCPQALGPNSAAVVPVAFTGGLKELVGYVARAVSQTVQRGL